MTIEDREKIESLWSLREINNLVYGHLIRVQASKNGLRSAIESRESPELMQFVHKLTGGVPVNHGCAKSPMSVYRGRWSPRKPGFSGRYAV